MPGRVGGHTLRYLVDVILALRTRADYAHVTLNDIPELRQLVDAVLAQETSYSSHTRVFVAGELWSIVLLGILHHRAEFVDVERHIMIAHTFLAVEHWAL